MFIRYKQDYPEYEEAKKIFTDIIHNDNCATIAKENNFSFTGQSLFFLSFKMSLICDSILLTFMNDYSMHILCRSIMEYYLKHFYIFYRFNADKNDDIGKRFLGCTQGELYKKYNAVLWPDFIQPKPPEHKEWMANLKEFEIASILEYIGKIETIIDLSVRKGIQHAKLDYSIASSYVHGGCEAVFGEIKEHKIQLLSTIYMISTYFFTIQTFTKFDSPNKKHIDSVRLKVQTLLDNSLAKYFPEK